MKFYGRHSVSSKYPYYLQRLLLYTVFLSLKFSILMFKLFCWKLHLNIDSTPLPALPHPLTAPPCPTLLAPIPCPFLQPPPPTIWAPRPKVNRQLKKVNYFDTQKLIWINTQGCVSHITELLNFVDVSGLRTYYATNVTVTYLTYVFPYKGMHSPNDLINLIEVQLTVIQFKLRFHWSNNMSWE